MLELAAVGTPSVVVEIADNQRGAIEALTAAGAARFAGTAHDPRLPASIQTIVADLCDQSALRDRMSAAGQRLIDGQGATRVARTLLQSL